MALLSPWGQPPARPRLETGCVHLWRLRCSPLADADEDAGRELQRLLSADELARAERLRMPEKAHAFVVGRARLRQVLGRYLDRAPGALSFTYGTHGKPALAEGESRLHFNLAHSGDWLLLAVAVDGPLGVDLERLDAGLDFAPLARRFLSAAEQNLLARFRGGRQQRAFYRLWTRKEAYLKGTGAGFAEMDRTQEATSEWRVRNLFVQPAYVAALAVRGKVQKIERWTWEM